MLLFSVSAAGSLATHPLAGDRGGHGTFSLVIEHAPEAGVAADRPPPPGDLDKAAAALLIGHVARGEAGTRHST